ncbi:hypothetical protein DFA_08385 [Cavenderia fasciculata]|uniref:CRAL-TRIO domain-containing protein n=1 Tax=Cavenderia fasciculata TaxID=261658 RepID=F4Q5Y1_CACFS|nr:uncharacterized protein DFA_08385 [Cavenderia fasciculata]EGG17390.1 hypothetical protein DFA_08385 [Cavenderia fasciculata]|eukprot:XP_004355874.1 hypothetical protein DFA_08385 [Cavenderia fasciculata]
MATAATIGVSELEGVTDAYKELMEKASAQDFGDIAQSGCFIPVGLDEQSHPVYLVLANKLPLGISGLDKMMSYMCKTLEPLVTGGHYSIIYSHHGLAQESTPDRAWLLKTYQLLPRNYKKNLKHFYILHPSTWLKVLFMMMSPFLSEKVWRHKVVYLDYLQELPDTLDRALIKSKIPHIVKEHDKQLLAQPEVAETVMSSMEVLGKELMSSFATPFSVFGGTDPSKWDNAYGDNYKSSYSTTNNQNDSDDDDDEDDEDDSDE